MIQQNATAVNDGWVMDWMDKVRWGDAPTWLGAVFAARPRPLPQFGPYYSSRKS